MRHLTSGCYGKTPAAGDFQSLLPGQGPDGAFFQWFNDGWVRSVLAGRRADLAAPMRFMMNKGGVLTLGVIHASRDRAGRRFPLFVFANFAELPQPGADLAGAESWWRALHEVCAAGVTELTTAALQERVGSLVSAAGAPSADGSPDSAAVSSASALPIRLPVGDAPLVEWLRRLEFAFSAARPPRFALRGTCRPDAPAWGATVDLMTILAGAAPTVLFWDTATDRIAWRALWGYPAARHFEVLLWQDASGEHVHDVESAEAIPESFTGRIGTSIDPSAGIEQLLAQFAHAYPST